MDLFLPQGAGSHQALALGGVKGVAGVFPLLEHRQFHQLSIGRHVQQPGAGPPLIPGDPRQGGLQQQLEGLLRQSRIQGIAGQLHAGPLIQPQQDAAVFRHIDLLHGKILGQARGKGLG